MMRTATKLGPRKARLVNRDETFRDLLAIASMIQHWQSDVATVSPRAAELLATSRQVLIAEMQQALNAALGQAAA